MGSLSEGLRGPIWKKHPTGKRQFRKEAKENALHLLEVNLNDVAGRIKRAENNLQTIITNKKDVNIHIVIKLFVVAL